LVKEEALAHLSVSFLLIQFLLTVSFSLYHRNWLPSTAKPQLSWSSLHSREVCHLSLSFSKMMKNLCMNSSMVHSITSMPNSASQKHSPTRLLYVLCAGRRRPVPYIPIDILILNPIFTESTFSSWQSSSPTLFTDTSYELMAMLWKRPWR
jgi:hypothetical protein